MDETRGKFVLKAPYQPSGDQPQAIEALTKGVIYPIVKKVASLIGAKMTKDIFAKGVAKAIPGIGAIFSGGITLATFLPMCNRLKGYLDDLAEGKEVPDTLDVAEVNCE